MAGKDYDYDLSDPNFERDLAESQQSVMVVAEWLRSKGLPVIIRPTFVRPSSDKMSEFSDSGDLEIIQRVEVKHRKTLQFTSSADFPYKTVIVDACHCYDNANPKPYAYIIVNRMMDAGFLVKCETRPQWSRVEKLDTAKGRVRSFYECPTKLVTAIALTQLNPL